ncbi:hypothetical protein So717_24480 [Roseobacter cerasinus]|uniref:Uncharacterized protein n=1 Tax=Roseobacter cerasinus TaxID=2602289 RepID=A0A640VUX2_9RHOB|nr:contractile injection system tape measure protein [Roseobacter cerasinus]GFE50695.1 hypothetical protein So717_24480 [Roseobacter cerasinus]
MSQPLARAPEGADHRIGTVLAEFEVTSQGSPLAAPETLAQKVRLELLPALEDVFAHPQTTGHDAVIEALEIDLGDWPDNPDWSAVRLCLRERMLSALAPYLRRASVSPQDFGGATVPESSDRVGQAAQVLAPLQISTADQSDPSQKDGGRARPSMPSAAERIVQAIWVSRGQIPATVSGEARKQASSASDDLCGPTNDQGPVDSVSAPAAERGFDVSGVPAGQTSASVPQAGHRQGPSASDDLPGSANDQGPVDPLSAPTAARGSDASGVPAGQTSASVPKGAHRQGPPASDDLSGSANDQGHGEPWLIHAAERAFEVPEMSGGQTSATLLQAAHKQEPSAFEDLLRDLPDAAHRALLAAVSTGDVAGAIPGIQAMERAMQAVFAAAGHSAQAAEGLAAQMVAQLLVRPVGAALATPTSGEPLDDTVSARKDGKAPIAPRQSIGRAPREQMAVPTEPPSGQRPEEGAAPSEDMAKVAGGQRDLRDLKADWSRDPERSLQTFAALDVPGLLALIQSLLPSQHDGFDAALQRLVQRSTRPQGALIRVLRAVLDGRPIDFEKIEHAASATAPEPRAASSQTEVDTSDHRGMSSLWRDVIARLTGDSLPPNASALRDNRAATSAVRGTAHTSTSEGRSTAGAPTGKTGETGGGTEDANQAASEPARPSENNEKKGAAISEPSSGEAAQAPDDLTASGASVPAHPDELGSQETEAAKGSRLFFDTSEHPAKRAASALRPQPDHPQPETEAALYASDVGVSIRQRIDISTAVEALSEAAFGPAAKDLGQMLDLIWRTLDADMRAAILRRLPPLDAVADPVAQALNSAQLPLLLPLDLIAQAGPGPMRFDEILTHLLNSLEPQADRQTALLRQIIARLGFAGAGMGASQVRDRLRAGLEDVLRARSPALVSNEAMGLAAAEEAEQRLLTQQAGLVLLHPFLKLLFSRLDVLSAGGRIISDHLPKGRAALEALCGAAPSERSFDPLARLLLGMTDDLPPPGLVELDDEDAALIEGLLRSVIAQWSKLGQTSPRGLQEAFLCRSGQIRFDSAGAHLRVDSGPFDMLLDGLPWTVDTTIALPWMALPCHVNWRSQDG